MPANTGAKVLSKGEAKELSDLSGLVDLVDEEPLNAFTRAATMPGVVEIQAMLALVEADA